MRGLILLGLFAAAPAAADYEETRELSLAANGISSLAIDAGSGSLTVRGGGGASIDVAATIEIENLSGDKARERIEESLRLTLERDGSEAKLVSNFEDGFFGWGTSSLIHLVVSIPAGMGLHIDDGSGPIDLRGVSGATRIEDGSGSIDVVDHGADLDIDDGSGSIDVRAVAGNVVVDDGSGSINIEQVDGSVTIDDGSGSIHVRNVGLDLIIVEAGSGSVNYDDIRGQVDYDDS